MERTVPFPGYQGISYLQVVLSDQTGAGRTIFLLHLVPLFVNFGGVIKKRNLIYFRHYYWDFFNAQKEEVKDKIDYVLFLVTVAERIPAKFFKRISGYEGLFEIRIEFESNIFRIFCCFDEGNLVVLFNGFQKKTQKTPKREIDKAARIKDEYFEYKKKGITK